MNNTEKKMDSLVTLCKGRGFVYPGSEIYGGLSNSWDYGPLGVQFKNNVKAAWWKHFIQQSPYNVGLDCGILMNPQVWVASGHVGGFSDPLMDCKSCRTRHRADTLIENFCGHEPDSMEFADMEKYIQDNGIKCPNCGSGDFTSIRSFNLMFKTFLGITEDSKSELFLRPETAQGIFVNFKNVQRTSRKKIPFGIGQIGKAFRNEITPGNFIFRIREFEQMELEFFCKPGTELDFFEFWKKDCMDFLNAIGLSADNLRYRDHEAEKLSHYSNATTDIEYLFPFGWGELWGIASRTDYDLKCHQNASGETLEYFDQESGEHYLPYCVEPSVGVDRLVLAALTDAYDEEVVDAEKNDTRVFLRLHPALAPYKCAILPLSKKLSEKATSIFNELSKSFMCDYDEAGSIGKRYRREDEIGTPFCITVDFETETDNSVTVRDRDTMEQIRLPIEKLREYIESKLEF